MSGTGPLPKGALAWGLLIAVLLSGWYSCQGLPRLEEPQFAVRQARVITPYPGASAAEVEQEISARVEEAVHGLDQLQRIESCSSRGLSVVTVQVQEGLEVAALQGIWDRLRRKIDDLQPRLPPGAGRAVVATDADDLYGTYYALVGAGFTPAELKRVAELVRHELARLAGVAKVVLFGEQQEILYVEISNATTRALGIGREEVFAALGSKDLPADAGRMRIGPQEVAIHPDAAYRAGQDLGDLMIAGGQDRLVRLGDIAVIRRGYEDPPRQLLRVDGRPAVGIAISTSAGHDLLATGKAVARRLAELAVQIPLGMELKAIALQSQAIEKTLGDSTTRLLQAAALVLAALFLLMGPRGGLVVGLVSLLTMAGTCVVMSYFHLPLERVSLGALVIALGMVPGNAIQVVEGMRLGLDQGLTGPAAARQAISRLALPLAVATAVILLAFAPGRDLANGIGHYLHPLFQVLLISLSIGWLAAMTAAPVLAARLLAANAGPAAAHGGRRRRLFGRILTAAIRYRRVVLGTTALLIAVSLYGLGAVAQVFLPSSDRPAFLLEVYCREGTAIQETEQRMDEIQAYLHGQEGVTLVATAIGAGHPRFLPTYATGPDVGSHYGVALVQVDDPRRIEVIGPRIHADLAERFADAVVDLKRFPQIPESAGGRIQLRIAGPDPAELRRLAERAESLIAADPDATAVRDDWGAKVKVAQPVLAREILHRLGIDRTRIASALRTTYSGSLTGYFREGSEPIPIVVRSPRQERDQVEDLAEIQVTSPLRGDRVSMPQMLERLDTRSEDARRCRRDQLGVIRVHAAAATGATGALFERIKPQVERALEADQSAYRGRHFGSGFAILGPATIPLLPDEGTPLRGRPGYHLGWGGEAESTTLAQAGLWARIPFAFGLILLLLLALFGSLRQPLIVLLALPPAMIGVALGLLLTGRPYGFLSLLGVLGLAGMLIGSAILQVTGIDRRVGAGEVRLAALLCAATESLRPLGIAAATAILVMVPLLQDHLFAPMALILLSGLGLAVLSSPLLVPLLYATLLRIRPDQTG